MSISPSHLSAPSCKDLNASAQRKVLSSSSVSSKSCSWYFYSNRVVHTVATHRFCYSPWTVGCTAVELEVSAVSFHPSWQSFVFFWGGGRLNSNCCMFSVSITHFCGTKLVQKNDSMCTNNYWSYLECLLVHLVSHFFILISFVFFTLGNVEPPYGHQQHMIQTFLMPQGAGEPHYRNKQSTICSCVFQPPESGTKTKKERHLWLHQINPLTPALPDLFPPSSSASLGDEIPCRDCICAISPSLIWKCGRTAQGCDGYPLSVLSLHACWLCKSLL